MERRRKKKKRRRKKLILNTTEFLRIIRRYPDFCIFPDTDHGNKNQQNSLEIHSKNGTISNNFFLKKLLYYYIKRVRKTAIYGLARQKKWSQDLNELLARIKF